MEYSSLLLFLVGLAVGSFLNVLSLRYDPDKPIFRREVFGGRSHCMACRKQLRWFELVPIVSFLLQRGRCRSCGARLSLQYPIVELLAGLLAFSIPLRLSQIYFFELRATSAFPFWFVLLSVVFVLAGFVLLFLSAVDARLKLIPDQANVSIATLGIAATLIPLWFALPQKSFLGHFALLFGFQDGFVINRISAALFGLAFFGVIVALTRGRGMGFGDVKLAAALGFLLGWPDIALASFLAFILGAFSGILLIVRRVKTMKSAVPFGPFIVMGALLVFFFGEVFMQWYFNLFP